MLLNRIIIEGGEAFFRMTNADGKVWLMPVKNMRVAMNLYQPSGIKGKLLKAFFPYVYRVQYAQRVAHAQKVSCGLYEKIHKVLCSCWGDDSLEFSLFGGTPCVHQKVTIQVSKGNNILGYVKVTDSNEIWNLFLKEKHLLEVLSQQGVKSIPQCLFCEEIEQNMYVFVQNTVKTAQSTVPHVWGALQENFLKNLEQTTQQNILFEDSDYYQNLSALLTHLEWLPASGAATMVSGVVSDILNRYSGKLMNFSAYHADFTPWNMFIESGKLFVFDWEYAQTSYPPGLDKYHFFTQTSIFEKHWGAQQIIRYLCSEEGKWVDKEQYVLYLADMIARFTLREKGKVSVGMKRSFELWFELLRYLLK